MAAKKTKKTKREPRIIRIECDFLYEVNRLFHHFSSQLSDGYWENSRGDYGAYEDGYYEDIWNCFDFDAETKFHRNDGCFIITLKSEPTWEDAEADCTKMHGWTDKQIVEYLRDAICESIEDCPGAFDFCYSDFELETLVKCIKTWKVLPAPLPKMTHAELVKLVGHDFEYNEG